MNKMVLVGIVALVVFVFGYFCISINYQNQEVQLRNLIKQKQVDNKNEFDNVWKKISQVAQVTEAQKEALKEILIGYAQARSGSSVEGKNGSLVNVIHEAVPNIDLKTFNNLQNIIVSARDGFTRRQKELLDFKREHDILLDSPVSGWFLSNCQHIDVTIITSSKTEKTFEAGKDDDVDVFTKKK